ncbi:hypothetical protein PoB_000488900 [Plakobranchus ocellatus]|uniref:Uncharacterized protein n=1 Tax=Plakobranchus ocellatus TaxID=259542 RepID=A0AAV3Y8J1_9GAST|nr:hypothetical protein PoB_000488900 [Plakobranchus ocellatus]
MATDGQKEQQIGERDRERGREADSQQDGRTVLYNRDDRSGIERLKTEGNSGLKRKATFCNVTTQPYSNRTLDQEPLLVIIITVLELCSAIIATIFFRLQLYCHLGTRPAQSEEPHELRSL